MIRGMLEQDYLPAEILVPPVALTVAEIVALCKTRDKKFLSPEKISFGVKNFLQREKYCIHGSAGLKLFDAANIIGGG